MLEPLILIVIALNLLHRIGLEKRLETIEQAMVELAEILFENEGEDKE